MDKKSHEPSLQAVKDKHTDQPKPKADPSYFADANIGKHSKEYKKYRNRKKELTKSQFLIKSGKRDSNSRP